MTGATKGRSLATLHAISHYYTNAVVPPHIVTKPINSMPTCPPGISVSLIKTLDVIASRVWPNDVNVFVIVTDYRQHAVFVIVKHYGFEITQ